MTTPDPYSPEWTVYWTLRNALRSWIKPKDAYRPAAIAEQVVKDLRQSNWHLIKGLPGGGHGSSPTSIKLMEERRLAFEQKVRELEAMSEDDRQPSPHQGKLDV